MTSAPAAEAIDDLIVALRFHGLSVGLDDAFRLAVILSHAGEWSEERRIRALKALVGRTEAERTIIDEVGALLIGGPAVERSPAMVGLGLGPGRDGGSGQPTAGLPEKEREVVPPKPRVEVLGTTRWPKRRIAIAAGAVVAVALAAALVITAAPRIKAYLATKAVHPPPSEPADAGSSPPPQPVKDDRPVPVPISVELRGLSPGERAWLERGADGLWILLAGLGLAVMTLEVGRRRRALTRDRKALELSRSTGPRIFSPRRLAPDARQPLDRGIIREMAFHFISAGPEEEAPWLDGVRTVEATCRAAGRLELVFGRWQRDRDVIFIEDTSESMQRWPLFAGQIASNLAAQGRQLIHLYMRGEPVRVGTEPSLAESQPLGEVLDAHPDHAVVIFSDAAALEDRERQRRAAAWVRRLGQAVWLHPQPRELWGDGPRFLHGSVPLVALERDELLRVGGAAGVRPLRPRWIPPLPPDDDSGAVLASWRLALGDEAYLGLASGALLATARCFNTRLFWTMVADRIVEGSWARFDRIWELPGIKVTPTGDVSMAPEVRDALVKELRTRAPDQAERVARWLALLIAPSVGTDSLGAAQGKLQIARLFAAAGLVAEERRELRALRGEGLTEILAPQLSRGERQRWGVDVRLRKPSPARLAAGLGVLALAAVAAVFVHRQPLLACTYPPTTTLFFTDPAHPRYPLGGVVALRAEPPLNCPLLATTGGPTQTLPRGDDGLWRLPLADCCATEGNYALSLGVAPTSWFAARIGLGYLAEAARIAVGPVEEERPPDAPGPAVPDDVLVLVRPRPGTRPEYPDARALVPLPDKGSSLPGHTSVAVALLRMPRALAAKLDADMQPLVADAATATLKGRLQLKESDRRAWSVDVADLATRFVDAGGALSSATVNDFALALTQIEAATKKRLEVVGGTLGFYVSAKAGPTPMQFSTAWWNVIRKATPKAGLSGTVTISVAGPQGTIRLTAQEVSGLIARRRLPARLGEKDRPVEQTTNESPVQQTQSQSPVQQTANESPPYPATEQPPVDNSAPAETPPPNPAPVPSSLLRQLGEDEARIQSLRKGLRDGSQLKCLLNVLDKMQANRLRAERAISRGEGVANSAERTRLIAEADRCLEKKSNAPPTQQANPPASKK